MSDISAISWQKQVIRWDDDDDDDDKEEEEEEEEEDN